MKNKTKLKLKLNLKPNEFNWKTILTKIKQKKMKKGI